VGEYFEQSWEKLVSAFENFNAYNALEIVLLAFVVYGLLVFLKNTSSLRLLKFLGIFIIAGILLNATIFRNNFIILPQLLNNYLLYIFVAILLLFPNELRRGLWRLSSPKAVSSIFNATKGANEQDLRKVVAEVVRSLQNMAKKNIGALLVVVPDNTLGSHIIDSGTMLDAKLTGALIESIFITKGPLHDGAVIVKGDRVIAAGCFLPLSQNQNISKLLGTRHRAAIGVTENSNAVTIICSEETGVISVAKDGILKSYYDGIMLQDVLEQVLGLKVNKATKINNTMSNI